MIVSNPGGGCSGRHPAIANLASGPSASAVSVGAARFSLGRFSQCSLRMKRAARIDSRCRGNSSVRRSAKNANTLPAGPGRHAAIGLASIGT